MSQRLNPYQPHSLDDRLLAFDRHLFQGEVTSEDVARLIDVPLSTIVLRALLLHALLILGIVLIAQLARGAPGNFSPVTAVVIAFGALCFAAMMATTRQQRANRMIEAYPDMVGPLQGEINSTGFRYYCRQDSCTHQVTWPTFSKVIVNHHGIRLQWSPFGGKFIALPARCIDGFEANAIRQMLERFRLADQREPAILCPIHWTDAPDDALRFEIPYRDRVAASNGTPLAYYSLVVLSLLLGMIALVLLFFEMLTLGAVAGILTLITAERGLSIKKQLCSQLPQLQSSHWGWLGSTGCHVSHLGRVRDVPWADVRKIEISENGVLIVSHDYSTFTILREHFLENDSSRLGLWRQSLPKELSVSMAASFHE